MDPVTWTFIFKVASGSFILGGMIGTFVTAYVLARKNEEE